MSRENIAIVRNAIDAWNREDWDVAFEAAAPGFELDMSRAEGPVNGVFDLEQARTILVEFAQSWESIRIEPGEFIEAGEHLVVVPQTMHVRGREGIEAASRVANVWTICDGAVEQISMYQERKDALEAVGLSEQDPLAEVP